MTKTTFAERKEQRLRKEFAEKMQLEVNILIEAMKSGQQHLPLAIVPLLAEARPYMVAKRKTWEKHNCLCDGSGCECLCHKDK